MPSTRNKVLDKNKVFFGLIHYILSEQKNVNWLIKSSLIDITGVNSTLVQKPFKSESILNDVVDFIREIKPYHTQFSNYFEQYETTSETANIPKNDWLQETIGLRFDAIKSTPDINKIIYKIVDTLPDDLDMSQYNKSGLTVFNNTDNKFYVRYYNDYDNEWFWEQSDEILSDDGYYFTSSDKKMYKVITDEDTNDYILEEFTKEDKNEFVKHRANRLFYINYWNKSVDNIDYTSINAKDKIFDDIKKDLNANFKGLTVDGGLFDIGNFGYDLFDYDTTDYDSPTVIYDYYFVKYYEDCFKPDSTIFDLSNNFNIKDKNYYQKSLVNAGEHKFSLNVINSDLNVNVYKVSNGIISEYYDYNISIDHDTNTNYIDVFTPLTDKEKIYVTSYDIIDVTSEIKKINKVDVLEASAFIPSESEVLHREFVYMETELNNEYHLRIPIVEINSSDKIAIQKETDEMKKVLEKYEFTYLNNEVIIYNGENDNRIVNEYNHIVMTQFDYKYLYDKVYMWEDRYGRSNNIVNLTGDRFLRSRYEEDRPSERIVSYPQSSFFGYLYNTSNENVITPNKLEKIYKNDYKNDFSYTNNFANTEVTHVEQDSNNMVKTISVKNNFGKKSGKILINSEIIEYKESEPIYNTGDDSIVEYELKGLSRGVDGTTVNAGQLPKYKPYKINIEVGDVVFPYEEKKWKSINKNYLYKSYNIINPNIKTYVCPSGYKLYSSLDGIKNNINDYIIVKKLSKINLLNDITKTSDAIEIDSPNIISGLYTKKNGEKMPIRKALSTGEKNISYTNELDYYYLKINDDIVKFKTITKISNRKYNLSNIVLPSKYDNYDDNEIIYKNSIDYPNDTFIYSSYPEDISYSAEIVEGKTFEYDIIGDAYEPDIKYVQMNSLNGDVNLYKIQNNNVYLITHSLNNETLYEEEDILFGKIVDDYVYKNNDEIYAKIDNDKFKSIEIIVTIDESVELNRRESLLIKVSN